MNEALHREVLSKVSEVALALWIIEITATTLGGTGGDGR
jgi:uncharacterized membrane-anchored protein